MRYLKTNKLYCFSPAVMIATIVIEVGLALWALCRYRSSRVTQLAVAMFVLLAIFQFAEYGVCEALFGIDNIIWTRVGFVAITLLPPLGLHLIYAIIDKTNKPVMQASYAAAAVFMAIFAFMGENASTPACLGNYVIFKVIPDLHYTYAIYYYGLELIALVLALRAGGSANDPRKRQALYAMALGYGVLLVPTTTVNLLDPTTIAGIPSIMCGFAVFMALSIALLVLPVTETVKTAKRKD